MDRKALREFTHNAFHLVDVDNENYKQWIFRYTFLELEKDLSSAGDITTSAIFPVRKTAKAKIIAKESGVFAGRKEIQYFLVDSDARFRPRLYGEFKLNFLFEEGEMFKKGDCLLELEADIQDLLAVERVVLNLLMRMSGVATFTKQIVDTIKGNDVLITSTRKTLWGLLDKRAVVLGGGGTHRVNLGDAILVKDTHLDLIDRDFSFVLDRISSFDGNARFVEIEVSNPEEAVSVSMLLDKKIQDKKLRFIGTILLDNMSAKEILQIIKTLEEKGVRSNILFEASGGITNENVLEYAKTGVDIISMGSLTNDAKSLDMTFKTFGGRGGS
jgi:nicotinate-nucleotide pyrophosphorylase (carboxylating)